MVRDEAGNSGTRTTWHVLRVSLPVTMAVVLGVSSAWLYFRPTTPHLNHLPLIRQSTPYTCGVAALQSVLRYYGQEWREDNLARELKSTPDQGTDYREIVRFARAKGLAVEVRESMTVDDLRAAVAAGRPVMVALQAWSDHPETYASSWEDGHYSIVVGFDNRSFYFMDPSTLGNYTFIPSSEFLARWHDYYTDRDGRKVRLEHFGIIFDSKSKPVYDPEALMPLR